MERLRHIYGELPDLKEEEDEDGGLYTLRLSWSDTYASWLPIGTDNGWMGFQGEMDGCDWDKAFAYCRDEVTGIKLYYSIERGNTKKKKRKKDSATLFCYSMVKTKEQHSTSSRALGSTTLEDSGNRHIMLKFFDLQNNTAVSTLTIYHYFDIRSGTGSKTSFQGFLLSFLLQLGLQGQKIHHELKILHENQRMVFLILNLPPHNL
ncbi:hypothetical protein EV361DRAFT_874169 [Lentinula raphanica]|nr:hypothetical protein EV361DRAFT_874169 [Lentinula raphanica]